MKAKKVKNYSGFSFIEAMLSMAVLTIGIIGVMPLLLSGMNTTNDSRDQQIAVLLAQEGVELIRNIRDNNWAAGLDSFSYFPSGSKSNCRIDKSYSDGSSILCVDAATKKLYIDANGFYLHSSAGILSKFQRKLIIDMSTAKQATVTSVVAWRGSLPTANAVDNTNCNTSNQCAYTKLVLSNWGEN